MSWVRFVPGFSRHPKRLKSGPISSWLWACSVDHCMEYLTDGFLDEAAVPGLCPTIVGSALKRAVDNLVAVGSWEKVDGGYLVHNYLEHNLSKAQVEADRQASRTRYTTWKTRHLRGPANGADAADPNAVAPPVTNAVSTTVGNAVTNASNNDAATFLPVGRSVSRTTKLRSKGGGSRQEGGEDRVAGQPTALGDLVSGAMAKHNKRAADRVAALKAEAAKLKAEGKA